MEVMIQRKNLVLDATVLSTYQGCGLLGNFRFNHRFISISGKSPSLEMGSIVHVIIEHYYKSIIAGKGRGDAILIGMEAGKVFSCEPTEIRNSEPDDIALVFKTMEEYFDYYKNDFWIPLEVEVVKKDILYTDDEVRIGWKAKLDAIVDTNQGIFSIDHKTMKQRRDTLSLNNQFMGQAILMHTNQVIINKIGFQTTLKPHEKFTRPVVTYNADRLFEWRTEIVPYWAKMILLWEESGYYPPNYTHCENKYGKCPFIDVCSSPPNLREDEIRRLFIVGDEWDPQNE